MHDIRQVRLMIGAILPCSSLKVKRGINLRPTYYSALRGLLSAQAEQTKLGLGFAGALANSVDPWRWRLRKVAGQSAE